MKTIEIIILSYIITSISGVLLHFAHKTFKKGKLLHIFSAINESTWEHMKLSFYPMLVIIFIQAFIKNFMFDGFSGIALISIIVGTFSVPLLYYPIRAIIGREVLFISISLYFVCVLLGFLTEFYLVEMKFNLIPDLWAVSGLGILLCIFAYFTYFPLKHELFFDPIYRKYGEFKQKFDK
jgi:hypothetical protein